jgi:hypothetical protein
MGILDRIVPGRRAGTGVGGFNGQKLEESLISANGILRDLASKKIPRLLECAETVISTRRTALLSCMDSCLRHSKPSKEQRTSISLSFRLS